MRDPDEEKNQKSLLKPILYPINENNPLDKIELEQSEFSINKEIDSKA